ncbi:helicase C-terminal domain-containing protein [Paucilactobacillus nenjiangensis]|uniref:helicase C-terminal domain-containing protein n=1 Tax=Paucilactobacillus nenjiangensis TaxID=1296540 RepID=UPI001CDCD1AA|nr:helicase C-terminal domain-containing protein [Paucilactobacillus nenjiangensis]
MDKQPIYSIVDLETTGTSVKNGDRIIQIGCVLISNNKIVNQFNTSINPQKSIPPMIEQLTGISSDDVKNAPYFDDVAGTLFSLLSGTIFVAHNVSFDFPFLNAEFERAGYPSLEISAIDTVTLSQILFPTAPGFRLRDLTSYLTIKHDAPHSADSDAEATGQLLIHLLQRIQQLPTLTLQTLVKLNLGLPFDTNEVFKSELANREKNNFKLPNNLYIKNNLVLTRTKKVVRNGNLKKKKYPNSKQSKEKLFGGKLIYRGGQAKMMNMIYNNFVHEESHNILIEAGTGIGKTLGYMLPLAYLSYPNDKIIVSTATNIQQRQMADIAVTQLNSILPFKISSVVLKGNSHYVDITRFYRSLSAMGESTPIQLLKARILIWLLETNTGDLDELNLVNYNSTYFNEIRHQGIDGLDKDSVFYNDDFLVRRQKAMLDADVIITNHSYLAQHAEELGTNLNTPYLVVDEAQHLSENILRQSRHEIDFQSFSTILNILRGLVNDGHDRNLASIFTDLPNGDYYIRAIQNDLMSLSDSVKQFEQVLYRGFMLNVVADEAHSIIEQPIDSRQLKQLLNPEDKLVKNYTKIVGDLNEHFVALDNLFTRSAERWMISDRFLMGQFESQLSSISNIHERLLEFIEILTNQTSSSVFWLTIRQSMDQSSMRLSGGLLTTNQFLSKNVYPYFKKPIFTGATLFSSSRSQFIYDQLDINYKDTKIKRIESPFDFAKHSKMYIAKDAPEISNQHYQEYLDYLCNTIYQLTKDNSRQTMVLFNSLLTIEQVYSKLRGTDLFAGREILAQGITGNRDKLLKQFSTSSNAILLGASSFWEGIDLPNEQLELLIVTRLPFDFPDAIVTRAENEWLQKNGKNPFYNSSLPKATLRLRQGIGRLIRTEDDRGVAVILDKRLVDRRYGQTILKTFPQNMPIEALTTEDLLTKSAKFFKHNQ